MTLLFLSAFLFFLLALWIIERSDILPKLLEENKIIDSKTSKNMQNMIGFRNIAVHEYKEIDTEILQNIIEKHLDDLLDFARIILNLKR